MARCTTHRGRRDRTAMARQPSMDDPLASLRPEARAKLRDSYLDEASPLVDDLETALLELERVPNDEAILAAAFRVAHTIKGSAASVGFRPIAAFTHEVENVLDALRGGKCSLEPSGLGALLSCIDMLRAFLAASRHDTPQPDASACLVALSAAFSVDGDEAETVRAGTSSAPSSYRTITEATVRLLNRMPEAERQRVVVHRRGARLEKPWRQERWRGPSFRFKFSELPRALRSTCASSAIC